MTEVNPKETSRSQAFELWMKAPMPMVTIFKTLDVSRLVKISSRCRLKPNMLLCWCIGKAACGIYEFYLLPVGESLMRFDHLAVNVVVKTKDGSISTCDLPFIDDLSQFSNNYIELTSQVSETGEAHNVSDDYMVIGTSALTECEIDGAVNIYSGIYNNPFLIWGKFRHKLFKTILPISFQFHHTQMDGIHAARFLNSLQTEINNLTHL